MSYDIWLEMDAGGEQPIQVLDTWNYTSNCAPMWCAAGVDLAEFDGRDADGCAEGLAAAIARMEAEPETYRRLNPSNGWGSYETLLPRLRELLAMLETAPRATVKVWR